MVEVLLLCCLLVGCRGGGGSGEAGARAAAGFFGDLSRSGDDVVRAGLGQGHHVVELPHGQIQVPAGQEDAFAHDVARAAADLPREDVAGLTDDEMADAVDYACKAKDLFEKGRTPTLTDAVEQVLPGDPAQEFRDSVDKLAEHLHEAQTSTDKVTQVAAFAVCQAVGLPR